MEPLYAWRTWRSLLNTVKPVVGFVIAPISTDVKTGIVKPLSDCTGPLKVVVDINFFLS